MAVAAAEIGYYRLKWLEYVALTLDYHDLTGQWPAQSRVVFGVAASRCAKRVVGAGHSFSRPVQFRKFPDQPNEPTDDGYS